MPAPDKILRLRTVFELHGLSRSTILVAKSRRERFLDKCASVNIAAAGVNPISTAGSVIRRVVRRTARLRTLGRQPCLHANSQIARAGLQAAEDILIFAMQRTLEISGANATLAHDAMQFVSILRRSMSS